MDTLTCNYYSVIKLHYHTMKVLKRILEGQMKGPDRRYAVQIPAKQSTDAIFILQEKYRGVRSKIYCMCLWTYILSAYSPFSDRVGHG